MERGRVMSGKMFIMSSMILLAEIMVYALILKIILEKSDKPFPMWVSPFIGVAMGLIAEKLTVLICL